MNASSNETDTGRTVCSQRSCPLCRGRIIEVLHHQKLQQPVGSPLPPGYDVVACQNCGFVYADTPAKQGAYDRYYELFSKYEDPATASGSGIDMLDAQRLEETADAIAVRFGKDARIVDIGCAAGGLLIALHRRGFRALNGVDAAPGCVAKVKALGHEAHCLHLSRLHELASAGPFDGVVLSHVLEHVVDLHSVMTAVSQLVAPGGRVYIETPNALRYSEHPYVPFYFFDSEHINHFGPHQLSMLGFHHGLLADAVGERTLEVAPGKYYPAAWAWMSKNRSAPAPVPTASHDLAAAVRAYVAKCASTSGFPVLQRLIADGTPTIVWGAGSFAQRLFGQGALADCRVVAIVDRDINKHGLEFGGHAVEAPELALARHPDAAILVVAAVHGDAIAQQAKALCSDARIEMLDSS